MKVDGTSDSISTSSASFRDELIQLCLHAGYSSFFTLKYPKETQRGEQDNGIEIIANQDVWVVHLQDSVKFCEPLIYPELGEIQPIKRKNSRTYCVTVPPHQLIFVRMAVTESRWHCDTSK